MPFGFGLWSMLVKIGFQHGLAYLQFGLKVYLCIRSWCNGMETTQVILSHSLVLPFCSRGFVLAFVFDFCFCLISILNMLSLLFLRRWFCQPLESWLVGAQVGVHEVLLDAWWELVLFHSSMYPIYFEVMASILVHEVHSHSYERGQHARPESPCSR